jgi:hypothetical protein
VGLLGGNGFGGSVDPGVVFSSFLMVPTTQFTIESNTET